jgi:hypothetical protein
MRIASGLHPSLFHYRETRGLEIDLLIEQGEGLDAVEIKSGATTTANFFTNLERFPVRLKEAGKNRAFEATSSTAAMIPISVPAHR